MIKKYIGKILPITLKIYLLSKYNKFIWGIYFKKYLKYIKNNINVTVGLIEKLIIAWNNQGYSAQKEYCMSLIEYAYQTKGDILECGSGISTLLVGAIANYQKRKLLSLEHLSTWSAKVESEIKKYELQNIKIEVRNLVNYGDYDWYDVNNILFTEYDICICDGPPGSNKGGRKGFFYLCKEYLTNGAIILVDDLERENEKEMIDEIRNFMLFDLELKGNEHKHGVIRFKRN